MPSISLSYALATHRICRALCYGMLLATALSATRAEAEAYNQVPEDAAGTIAEVRFEGNDVTRDVILRQELTISAGDPVSRASIEASRQALMNLGLFKRVRARVEPVDGAPFAQSVVFSVSEKWYILPLPKFDRDSEGDYPYGMELSWDNFLGLNQSLELEYETTQRDDGIEEVRKQFSYDIPRIPRTQFGLSASLQRRDTVQTQQDPVLGSGEYDLKLDTFSWAVSRWLLQRGPSVGWRGTIGSRAYSQNYSYRSGVDGLIDDRRIMELWVGVVYSAICECEWHRSGEEYGWSWAVSTRNMGSDDGYSRLELFYRRYRHAVLRDDDNLNLQFQVGYGNDYDEAVDAFALGGAKELRGYDGDDVRGDAMLLLNLEYLAPLSSRYRGLRGVIFADAGNGFATSGIDLADLRYAAGLGLRWKVRSLVRTDLRVDAAWNFEDEDYKIYAGTQHSF